MLIPIAKYSFSVPANYRQFYLIDSLATGSTAAPDFWTTEAFHDRVATNHGIIGVRTESEFDVPLVIELYEAKPDVDDKGWDHITEASLQAGGGNLLIYGCPDEKVGYVALERGTYRVRVYYGNLDSVVGEDYGDTGKDHYKLSLWQEEALSPPIVLKRWAPQLKGRGRL
jgi:hypothetical protein